MYSYVTVLLGLILAEVARRFCKTLLTGLSGPLAKIPGPWLSKFTSLSWRKVMLEGNQINESPKVFAKYGDVVRVGPNDILIASKAACYQVIVESDLRKSPQYSMLDLTGIPNLFTERDTVLYKQKVCQRRLLSAGFSISYINGLEPLMQDCIGLFVDALNKKCAGGKGPAKVDISHLLANLTFDVMSATSFGGSFELTRTEDSKMRQAFHMYMMKAGLNAQMPWLKYVPFGLNTASPEMDEMITTIVSKRRESMKAGESKKDLLQIFLDAHDAHPEEFTVANIYNEMRLFMIAGSDTTSTTAQFTVFLLLENPEKLRLLLEEIDSAFPNNSDEISILATQDLSYLNACINESMRLMPIVRSGVPRIAEQKIVLDGYEIPPGTVVTAFIDATMRDPRIWSAADQFVPERWLEGKVDRKAFLPFSAGMRSCIGQQFAMKELRLILVTLLRKFQLSTVEGQNYEMRVHTVPYLKQGKYLVGVRPRV